MKIEVVNASASRPKAQALTLPEGTCVAEALVRFGWMEPEEAASEWGLGVFGRPVPADYVLQDGDRLEICPPLEMSPQEARRRRAAAEDRKRSQAT